LSLINEQDDKYAGYYMIFVTASDIEKGAWQPRAFQYLVTGEGFEPTTFWV
jgi:hypothetical protein